MRSSVFSPAWFLLAGLVLSSDPDDCSLNCNHGECEIGEGSDSMFLGLEDIYEKYGATENLPFLEESPQEMHDGMHCVCDPGYIGTTCDIPMEICAGSGGGGGGGSSSSREDHACFNSGECAVGKSEVGNEYFYCDCSKAGIHDAKVYAGHFCDKAAREYCATGSGVDQTRHSFCVHGTCTTFINPNEEHPGCICDDGYEGSHCEFPEGTTPETVSNKMEGSSSDKRKLSGGLIFVIILVCSGTFLSLLYGAKLLGDAHFSERKTKTKTNVPAEAVAGNIEADGSATMGTPEPEPAPLGSPEASMENEGELA